MLPLYLRATAALTAQPQSERVANFPNGGLSGRRGVRLHLAAHAEQLALPRGVGDHRLVRGRVAALEPLELIRLHAEDLGRQVVEGGDEGAALRVDGHQRENVPVGALRAAPSAVLAREAGGVVADDLLVALGARGVPHEPLLGAVAVARISLWPFGVCER